MTLPVENCADLPAQDKTVLITGASGLLGLNLALSLYRRTRIVGICNNTHLCNTPFEVIDADLTDRSRLDELLNSVRPDVIINCAALANLERCEEQPDIAHRLNAEMPGWLAAWSRRNGCRLLHISTDAVFDGIRGNYRETDEPNPLSRYAVTKLAGEQQVLAENSRSLICRVNFYGFSTSGARSLAEWFYNNLSAGKSINGFTDVLFCPLFVMDLGDILWKMIHLPLSGVYHAVSSECLSKYAFGVEIARTFGFDERLIRPASWKDAGLKAVRSPDLRLSVEKIQKALGSIMPDQKTGLQGLKKQLDAGYPDWIKSFIKQA